MTPAARASLIRQVMAKADVYREALDNLVGSHRNPPRVKHETPEGCESLLDQQFRRVTEGL